MSSLAVREIERYRNGRLLESDLITDTSGEDDALHGEFERLAELWKRETVHMSSTNSICKHDAYQQIIALGEPVVPFILHDLREDLNHWFWALKKITGADPVPVESRGNLPLMREAWFRWATEKGITF